MATVNFSLADDITAAFRKSVIQGFACLLEDFGDRFCQSPTKRRLL
jgi:hypothetical protein